MNFNQSGLQNSSSGSSGNAAAIAALQAEQITQDAAVAQNDAEILALQNAAHADDDVETVTGTAVTGTPRNPKIDRQTALQTAIADTSQNFVATDVETALAELFTTIDDHINQPEPEPVTTPDCTITIPTTNTIEIDSTQSTYDNRISGGTIGRHYYQIDTMRSVLDITTGHQPVTMIAGANVTATANGGWVKSNTGDSWNSWVQSDVPVGDASLEDFAIRWLVETSTGTVREMIGLDDNPSQNASFSSGEAMLYQVNHTTAYRYENGTNAGNAPVSMTAGDYLGIKVEKGVLTYFHERAGVITPIFPDNGKRVSGPLYVKGAFNRGSTSSGNSEIAGVEVMKTLTPTPVFVTLEGAATEIITQEDIEKLQYVGIDPTATSNYGYIIGDLIDAVNFPSGTQTTVVHDYAVSLSNNTASYVRP